MGAQRAGRIIGFVRQRQRLTKQEAKTMAKFTQMAPAQTGTTDRSGSGKRRSRRARRRNRRRSNT